jgi:hypothetical protein
LSTANIYLKVKHNTAAILNREARNCRVPAAYTTAFVALHIVAANIETFFSESL